MLSTVQLKYSHYSVQNLCLKNSHKTIIYIYIVQLASKAKKMFVSDFSQYKSNFCSCSYTTTLKLLYRASGMQSLGERKFYTRFYSVQPPVYGHVIPISSLQVLWNVHNQSLLVCMAVLPSSSVSMLTGLLRTPSPLSVLADTSITQWVYFFSPKQKQNRYAGTESNISLMCRR